MHELTRSVPKLVAEAIVSLTSFQSDIISNDDDGIAVVAKQNQLDMQGIRNYVIKNSDNTLDAEDDVDAFALSFDTSSSDRLVFFGMQRHPPLMFLLQSRNKRSVKQHLSR